jgi:hypothetical protein
MIEKTNFNIDLFGEEKKRKKKDDDLAAGIAHICAVNDYKLAVDLGSDLTKSMATTKLLNTHDYETQQKYNQLQMDASFARANGNIDFAKTLDYKAEDMLLSLPWKKR